MQEASPPCTFKAGASVSDAYTWTVPAATKAGAYTLYVSVYNPTYSVNYAEKTTTLTVTAARAQRRRRIWSRRWSAARPRSATPYVNDRHLDGRNILCLSVGRERGKDRGGDGGDVRPPSRATPDTR